MSNKGMHDFMISLLIRSGIYRILARVFGYTAKTGVGSNICLKEGFLPLPVHFYSPVPDIAELQQRNVWNTVSDLPGIDFRREEQSALRQFWTEQYLLQSFLCFNSEFEVLLAMGCLMKEQPALFSRAFPYYDSQQHQAISGSCWIRRRISGEGAD